MSAYRCRKCQADIDGMGSACPGCGTPQQIPVAYPGGVTYIHSPQTLHAALWGLLDQWLDGSKVAVALGETESTADTLRECATQLADVLGPRGFAISPFHSMHSAYGPRAGDQS